MGRPSLRQPLSLALALLLGAVITAADAPGAEAGAPPLPPPPSNDELRQLQLLVQACGRDNSVSSCDRARQTADPLLDHPRLSAACKDSVWQVIEQARPAAINDFRRREAINQSALDLVQFCRLRPTPAAPAGNTRGGGKGP